MSCANFAIAMPASHGSNESRSSHVNLYTATTNTGMLLKCRLKHAASENTRLPTKLVQSICVIIRIDVRCADQFERFRRASSFRNLCAFEMHRARKHCAESRVGMFGEGNTHGASVSSCQNSRFHPSIAKSLRDRSRS